MEEWSIAVRTVGGKHVGQDDTSDFSVTVSPDDNLACLHHQIEHVTGLKASQQRLIYRGRLISGGDDDKNDESTENKERKVRDVVGLCDGQTIHLVPKRNGPHGETNTNDNNENVSSENDTHNTSSDSLGRTLLAALLGLGSLEEDNSSSDDPDSPSLRRLRSSRSRRRASHRLTHADTVVPDPGTMEPVRQGLLTLHTMLDTTQTDQPWEANRQWYRGQWVDCRDTVNQWLEATILDIAHPDDILPQRTLSTTLPRRRTSQPTSDEAVSANDYEGRRNLLLEPDGRGGLCERNNNHGVHLLLIHYNGWPSRWDEWIRSDSERLRPFRTRTRHNPSTGALPTPQSVFDGAPSTNIKEEDEEADRAALLPELSRAMASVNDILQGVVTSASQDGELLNSGSARPNSDLPWLTDADAFPSAWSSDSNEPRYSRRQLEALAPLLDRLGRALTDAAPHVASFAATLPRDSEDESRTAVSGTDPENNVVIVGEDPAPVEEERPSTGGGFFSLLSREGRSRASTRENVETQLDESIREEPEPVDPDYVDFVNGAVNTTRGEMRSGRRGGSDDGASLLGAYLALSSLAGEGESNNNTGGGGMLGRLLRDRGNNENNDGGGPAIDIHIHAIVTAPGVIPGALGMAMMPGIPPPPLVNATNLTPSTNTGSRGLFSSRRGGGSLESHRAATNTDDDDMGIFADLYSENPPPLDPYDSATSNVTEAGGNGAARPRHEEENEDASTSQVLHGPTRPVQESPSRSTSSSQRSSQTPRRSRSSIGRVFRGMMGSSRRRSSEHDSDSE